MIDFKKILSIFFPAKCPFCNEIIPYNRTICISCEEKINYKNFIDTIVTRSGYKFVSISPFSYEEPIRTAIHKFKFKGVKSYALPFGTYITNVLKENIDLKTVDYIASVPLHRTREKERGFNQSGECAREISRLTGIKYKELLRKIKKNKIQHELSLSERAENVIGVYELIDKELVRGKTVIICDDILTSGNTLAECANLIYEAGAAKVIGATIANVQGKLTGTVRKQ